MRLIPGDIKIPKLYETEKLKPEDVKIPVKLFNPVGGQSWYISELADDGNIGFGFCNLGDDEMAELGYVSIEELESLRLPFGLSIERDLYWNPDTTLHDVMRFKVR